MNELQELERKRLAVSAFFVGLGTLTSRGLGFVRDMAILHYFSRTETDAFFVAFRLPNLFRRLFGEGALTVSFVPVLSDFLKNDDKKEARAFVSALFTLLFLFLSFLTVLGTWGSGPLVKILTYGEGFNSVPGKLELTIHLAQIMFCYILLVSLYAYGMGVLNTLRVFWLPAVAPALWNLTMIIGVIFFRDWFQIPSEVLAWATVIGGVLQALILVPALYNRGFLPFFRKFWGDPAVKKVLKAMGPSVVGLSVMQVAVLINTYFASQLEEGSNSWIFTADRFLELPLSLFAVSLGTVALPTLSSFWSRNDREGMASASLHALKLVLFMAIPCSVGLLVLSKPIIQTLFEHGRFTSHDTEMTSQVLQVYGLGMIFAAGVRVLAPAFYAMKNTWLPALSAAIALICHVFIAQNLMKLWGIQGLALSSVLSGFINLFILFVAYEKFVSKWNWPNLAISVGRFILASLALLVTSETLMPMYFQYSENYFERTVALLLIIFLSMLSFFGAAWLLKTPELTETFFEFYKRFKKK